MTILADFPWQLWLLLACVLSAAIGVPLLLAWAMRDREWDGVTEHERWTQELER